MLHLFQNKPTNSAEIAATTITPLSLPSPCYPALNFEQFAKGIDNVHVDVHLSPRFVNLIIRLVHDLFVEHISKRQLTEKPSMVANAKLDEMGNSYAAMLTTTIHRVKEEKRLDAVQLLQVAVVKFVLNTVQTKAEQLLYELRKASTREQEKTLELHERIKWLTRYHNNLIYQINADLFAPLHWVELNTAKKLRESLLGVAWSIPEDMLFNPLLSSPDNRDHELLMMHYVLLSEDSDNNYGFDRLTSLLDKLLDTIASQGHLYLKPPCQSIQEDITDYQWSWKDVPANMDALFNLHQTQQALEMLDKPDKEWGAKLQYQRRANQLLVAGLRHARVIEPLLAAYEVPRLYEYYAKRLKPSLLHQALCNVVDIEVIQEKLESQPRVKSPRRQGDSPITINELVIAKKKVRQAVQSLSSDNFQTDADTTRDSVRIMLWRFIKDLVTYRRDLKYSRFMHEAMADLNLLTKDADIHLSRTNGLLNEFLEPEEYSENTDIIRGHVILKADLRGSTTMTAELCKRGLNPATHFSRNFFDPIRQLLEVFGAEKVFIEGDAVIHSLFEYQNAPEQWLATARACGLAKSMLEVVKQNNQVSRAYDLPELELGIGICYSPVAPKFLYDGEQRIMISPAIGDADRLSSCSWKLRRKYAQEKNLLTNVMVFKQPPTDAFQGEKGMTTFRYNLNGIELEAAAFEKLQKEIALRQCTLTLPGDEYQTDFYTGHYPDTKGADQEVFIRAGRVKVWQENSDYYPVMDTLYYEVVANKTLINMIKRAS